MSRNSLLSCLAKRDLLNQVDAPVSALLNWGKIYEEADLVYDAVDFYEKAGAKEALTALMEKARDEGDFFLFFRACRALGREAAPEEWIAVGKRAEELGKTSLAEQAYRRGGVRTES